MKKRGKKVVLSLLVALMLFQSVGVFAQTDGEKLKALDLVSGDASGNLNESKHLTRAEFATLICKLNKVDGEAKNFQQNFGFSDVTKKDWFYGYVNYAKYKGWLNGVSATKYGANEFVSEEMIATVIMRLLGYSPKWGEAVYSAAGVGIDFYPEDANKMTRGDVFNYIFEALLTKMAASEVTFSQSLGIDLKYDIAQNMMGLTIENMSIQYYDIKLNPILENDRTKDPLAVSVTDEEGYSILKKGTVEIGRFDQVWYSPIRELENTTTAYYDESSYVVLNQLNHIVRNDKFPIIKGASFKKFAGFGFVYSDQKEEDYLGFSPIKIFDWTGKLLYSDAVDAYVYNISDTLIGVVHKDKSGYIYDGVANKVILTTKGNESGEMISATELLLRNEETEKYAYQLYNIASKQSKFLLAPSKGTVVYFNWYYNSPYGQLSFNDSETREALSTTMPVFYNKALQPIVSKNFTYDSIFDMNTKLFLIEKGGKFGLADDKGNIKLPIQYMDITWYNSTYLSASIDDKKVDFYDKAFKKVDVSVTYLDATILPTGQKILDYDLKATFVDSTGKVILSGTRINYISNLNILVVYSGTTYKLYNIDGTEHSLPTSYDQYYNANNRYIGAIKEGVSYLLDKDGKVVFGPFNKKIYFSLRQ